jgi:elongation factor P
LVALLTSRFRQNPPKLGVLLMVKATQLRPGMVIRHNGDLYTIFSVDHRTPGNKRGSMQTKMRNLRNGAIMDYRFRAEEFVERAVLDQIEFEFLYGDGEGYHFMDSSNYEQMILQKDILGEAVDYLIPNMPVKLEFYQEKASGSGSAGYRRPTRGRNRAQHSEGNCQRGNEARQA